MANLGISEFTFSFAFLHEHLNRNWQYIRAIPCLPSLRLENNSAYDVNIIQNGTIFFYQFKTSTFKSKRFSRENEADRFYRNTSYYKFYLYPKNEYSQHSRLLALATDFPDTYYVAPCLNNQNTFSQAFFNHQIIDNSRRIQLGNHLNLPAGDNHIITYQTLIDQPQIFSKKRRPVKGEEHTKIDDFYNSSISRLGLIDRDYFSVKLPAIQKIGQNYLNKRFRKTFQKKINNLSKLNTIESVIEGLSDIMNFYFNINLILVGNPNR